MSFSTSLQLVDRLVMVSSTEVLRALSLLALEHISTAGVPCLNDGIFRVLLIFTNSVNKITHAYGQILGCVSQSVSTMSGRLAC